MLAEKAGSQRIEIEYFQRYGNDNLLGWLKEKELRSEVKKKIFTATLSSVWKSGCSENGLADYMCFMHINKKLKGVSLYENSCIYSDKIKFAETTT